MRVPSEEKPMPTPLGYEQIATDITNRIRSGELRPGEKLPSYAQLSAQYGASVTTVQNALRILRERGLIRGEQGKAVYVAEG